MAKRPAAKKDGQRALELAPALGQRVRQFRVQRNISQADLAAALGTVKEAISRLERGQVAPSLGRIDRIAELLDVPLRRLLTAEDEDQRSEVVEEFARLVDNIEPGRTQALLGMVHALVELQGIEPLQPVAEPEPEPDPPPQRIRSKLKGRNLDEMRDWMRRGCPVDDDGLPDV